MASSAKECCCLTRTGSAAFANGILPTIPGVQNGVGIGFPLSILPRETTHTHTCPSILGPVPSWFFESQRRRFGGDEAGSSRTLTGRDTLMDMRTDVTAVPHAGLGFHFLRVTVENQRILGVFKRRGGPKGKETNDDRGSNKMTAARAHLQKVNQIPKQ